MKYINTLPTEDNILNFLQKDAIDRNKDVLKFYEFLTMQEDCCSIALDGKWGSGKTFFVQQCKYLINARNPYYSCSEEMRNKILNSFAGKEQNIYDLGQLAIYYDAWANDNDTDPVLSIIYEITQQLKIGFSILDTSVAEAFVSIFECFLPDKLTSVIKRTKELVLNSDEDPFQILVNEKGKEKIIKDFFDEILAERGNRLILFIDELDRCRPDYAVRLLEQVKHYLELDRITFVFSVNQEQLQHTIKKCYGYQFDACRYLDRFFDYTIQIPEVDMNFFYNELKMNHYHTIDNIIKHLAKLYRMELREIVHFSQQVKTAINGIKTGGVYVDDTIVFLSYYIVPLMCSLKMMDRNRYDDFIEGKQKEPLVEFFKTFSEAGKTPLGFLNPNKLAGETLENKRKKFSDDIEELYNALFAENYTNKETYVAGYLIDDSAKAYIFRCAGLLSEFTDYKSRV